MRFFTIRTFLSAAMLVAPLPLLTGQAAALQPDATPSRAAPYVAAAGAADMFEIESGRLASQRGRPATRRFGQMLMRDHQQTTRTTLMAAREAGLRPGPARMTPPQMQMIAQLRRSRGAMFERNFWRFQVQAHEEALALHRNYAGNGDAPPLRTTAQAAVPVVTHHLEEARSHAR